MPDVATDPCPERHDTPASGEAVASTRTTTRPWRIRSLDTPHLRAGLISSTVPGWFVGLLIHAALAATALVGAWRSVRTPAERLIRGSRIA